jgi:hypothetical protein
MQIQVINLVNLSPPSQPIRALEVMQQQIKVTNLINLSPPKSANQSIRKCKFKSSTSSTFHHQVSQPEY